MRPLVARREVIRARRAFLVDAFGVRPQLVKMLLALKNEHRCGRDVTMSLTMPAIVIEADQQVDGAGVSVMSENAHVVLNQYGLPGLPVISRQRTFLSQGSFLAIPFHVL